MSNLLFVSHASEDKLDFVRPLAEALKRAGMNVWFDEFSLKPGDSLRRSIDKGLSECDVGVVVISPAFFSKEWPQRELDALLGGSISGETKLIPIWHNVDAAYVRKFSPLLCDLIAISSSSGIEAVVSRLLELFPVASSILNETIAQRLEQFYLCSDYEHNFLLRGCHARFMQLVAFHLEQNSLGESYFEKLDDVEVEERQNEIEVLLHEAQQKAIVKYGIPVDCYLDNFEGIEAEDIASLMDEIEYWVGGFFGLEESEELLLELDDYFDFDWLYLLFAIPNFSVSGYQRQVLRDATLLIGAISEPEHLESLKKLCIQLRRSDDTGAPKLII